MIKFTIIALEEENNKKMFNTSMSQYSWANDVDMNRIKDLQYTSEKKNVDKDYIIDK